MPSVGTREGVSGELPHFLAGEVLVRAKARLRPLFNPEEVDRWYVPEEHRDRDPKKIRKLKNQLGDSMLAALRCCRQLGCEAILAQGEAIGPLLVMMNAESRWRMYGSRRVTGQELDRLEGAYLNLSALLISGPCFHPPHVGLREVQRSLAGAERVVAPAHLQIRVLRLEGDPVDIRHGSDSELD